MTDPAMDDLRHDARMATGADTIRTLVHKHADSYGLNPSAILEDVDWNIIRVGRHGEVSERAIKRLLRSYVRWQAAQ